MKNSDLINNTKIILQELTISSREYLQMLSHQERENFIGKWAQICSSIDQLDVDQVLVKVNELIYEFENLRHEFLGNINLTDIAQVKFDPNAVWEIVPVDEKSDHANTSVKIKNEVVNAGKKIREEAVNLNSR